MPAFSPTWLAGPAAAALAALSLGAAPALAKPPASSHAVFVQTDALRGNAVVAYDRAADGTLHRAGTYPTGGRGGRLAGAKVDYLASQGSLVYDRAHHALYAVNAGSDSITAFTVEGDRLSHRQVLGSGGHFPASIAVHGNLVYVLNVRSGAVVQGFRRVGAKLRRVAAWRRPLGLTDGTPEFTSTPGQVLFAPGGDRLLITTKGDSSSVDTFAVAAGGRPSAQPVVTALPGAVPFAGAFDASGRYVLAEAGTNAVASFTLGGDGMLAPIAQTPTGQQATCWIVASGGRFYVSNAASGTVSTFTLASDGTPVAGALTPTDAGTVDAAATADGRFLYVQTGAKGIVDEFRIGGDGALTAIGKVRVPHAAGGEGIATS